MKRRTMMAMRHADNRSDLLEVQWVLLILALRCPLALFSLGVRSQLPQRLESTSCALFSPRDVDALWRSFVSSKEYSLRILSVAGLYTAMVTLWLLQLPTRLHVQFVATICLSIIQIPTTMNGGPSLSSWIVQRRLSL